MDEMIDRYDFEAWQNKMIDNLKENYHLDELSALKVLRFQKPLVNKLFDDFTKGEEQELTDQLELLMNNDLENDCWN